jgi:nucleoside-diphosphate-sugar epimerase
VGRACERGIYTIFVSSVTAIFDPKQPVTGDSPLIRSKTIYGRSKAECDGWVRKRQAAGAPVSIVYPAGVVGPDDPGFSESVKAYRTFLRGTLRSEGGNLIVDVRDLAVLLTRMLEAETRGRIVAAGHFFDWDDFTHAIEQSTGADIPRIRAPGWLLRGGARMLDVVGRLTGRTMRHAFV